jgi:hypothetical protein
VVDDVDAALAALFAAASSKELKLECSFDAPTPEWSGGVKSTTLNLFLLEITENPEARPGAWADVRDDTGQIVGRQPPLRRYDLHYVLSAWGGTTEAQHRALSAVLRLVPAYDTIPVEFLSGALVETELPVRLRIAQDELSASVTDIWSSLGQPARASLALVATAPVLPALITDLAPPASSLDVGLAGARPRAGRAPVPDLTGVEPVDARVTPAEEEANPRWTKYRVRERIDD